MIAPMQSRAPMSEKINSWKRFDYFPRLVKYGKGNMEKEIKVFIFL